MKLKNRFQRSKAFAEAIYSKSIPNKLLIEQDGRILLFSGKIDEVNKRMEKAVKPIKSFSRLDNAKVALEKMEERRLVILRETRQLQQYLRLKDMQK